MHCQPLIHWKGYPKTRFPRIRFGPKRRPSRSSHASSSIRKTRKRRISNPKRTRLHNLVQEEVFGWKSPSSHETITAGSLNPEPVSMVIPSNLVHTGDGAEGSPFRMSIEKGNDLLRPQAPAPGYAPSTRAICATTEHPNTSESTKHRIYDSRISPRRLLKRETPPNTTVGSPSIRSLVPSLTSGAFRSPSQRRTLRRFVRELELHLKAVDNLPKKSLIPTPSITTIHTVEGLKPYRKQLLSAGLAVTSADQRKRSSSLTKHMSESQDKMEKRQRVPNNPKISLGAMDGSHKSYASSCTLSTDHVVLSWTPPHGESEPKPIPPPPKRLSQVTADDILDTSRPRKMTTFKQTLDARDSLPTYPAPRPVQASPRSSLPWLQQQPKAVFAPSISMKSPKHASSPAESAKSQLNANLATQSSFPCIQWQSVFEPSLKPTRDSPDDGLSIGVKPPMCANKGTQTSPPEVNAKGCLAGFRDVFSGRSYGACSQEERSLHLKGSSPTQNCMLCPMCQTRQPSTTVEREEPAVLCPLCSTRQPSHVIKRNRSVVVCSLCSTRRPSAANIDQSNKWCPWCSLFQPPPPENEGKLCTICLALQEENSNSQPSVTKKKQNLSTPMYNVSNHAIVPDPIKRSPPEHTRVQSESARSSQSIIKSYIDAKMQTALPPVPIEVINGNHEDRKSNQTSPLSSMSHSSTLGLPRSRPKANNKAVFRGLQVATDAACDEDIDQWVFEVTGRRVRDFLADLSMLRGIGASNLAEVARRAAKQRRNEVRVLEEMRRMNLEDEDES